jgi:hypothetical protein
VTDQPQVDHTPATPVEEPPPVFGTWRRLYIAVLVYLSTLIALFYAFTIAFNGGQ